MHFHRPRCCGTNHWLERHQEASCNVVMMSSLRTGGRDEVGLLEIANLKWFQTTGRASGVHSHLDETPD